MKRNLCFAGLIFFCLVLQTTVLASLPHQLAKPDLVLIVVFYLGLSANPLPGAFLAFFSGFMMDIFSGSIFGVHTFSKTFIFFLTILIKDRFYARSPLFQVGAIVSFSAVEGVIIISILGLVAPLENLLPSFLLFIIPKSLITGLVGPFCIGLIKRVPLLSQGAPIRQ
jgi:rod shape-determining protein MreD